jgi:hypothetical protein
MQYKFVSYLRVSTDRQGKSGLGLEAQRQTVADFLKSREGRLLGEHVEVESGKNNDRPKLGEALAVCRMTGATLVVAKIDRLARNVRFLLTVVEGCGEGGVMFCDLPALPAGPVGEFMLNQMAAVAALEAGLISERTICGRPLRCKLNLREETACRLGADICPASDAAIHLPRARMGVRGSGPNQRGVLKAHWCALAC